MEADVTRRNGAVGLLISIDFHSQSIYQLATISATELGLRRRGDDPPFNREPHRGTGTGEAGERPIELHPLGDDARLSHAMCDAGDGDRGFPRREERVGQHAVLHFARTSA
jgi:hypothetical protein